MDTLKMLLGGDTFNAKVKYENDAVVQRTPVIVLSNNDIFPKDSAFTSIMLIYEWKTAPLLREYKRKPHPIGIYALLEKYNIFEEVHQIEEHSD